MHNDLSQYAFADEAHECATQQSDLLMIVEVGTLDRDDLFAQFPLLFGRYILHQAQALRGEDLVGVLERNALHEIVQHDTSGESAGAVDLAVGVLMGSMWEIWNVEVDPESGKSVGVPHMLDLGVAIRATKILKAVNVFDERRREMSQKQSARICKASKKPSNVKKG